MSESPPNPGEFDDVDEHYRRVTALEKGGPSESVRRAVLGAGASCDAEIQELHATGGGQEDVGGFDVTMHDPALVGGRQTRRDHDQGNQAVKYLLPAAGNSVSQLIGQQHGGVAEPIVLQLAGALLSVFSQRISSCKIAQ
jgi:hypothetical protein